VQDLCVKVLCHDVGKSCGFACLTPEKAADKFDKYQKLGMHQDTGGIDKKGPHQKGTCQTKMKVKKRFQQKR